MTDIPKRRIKEWDKEALTCESCKRRTDGYWQVLCTACHISCCALCVNEHWIAVHKADPSTFNEWAKEGVKKWLSSYENLQWRDHRSKSRKENK